MVISPLISLMEDQVMSLNMMNIRACLLGTAQKDKGIYEDIVQGLFRIVYLTPEFITGDLGRSMLKRLEDNLTLVAIDEAHCVSSWGHDFRSAFRQLSCIRETVKKVPILALTATATKSVLDDIVKVLKLRDPQKLCSGFDRPNLKLIVRCKHDKWMDLQKIITEQQDGSIIIYCLKRDDTEKMAQLLNAHGVQAAAYHAGLSLKTRKSVHEQFVKDQLRIIVATVAFGMGIDKPDVRVVVNYGASREIESYYQEIGRAGRDGQPARCITFFSKADFEFHAFMRDKTKNQLHRTHLQTLNNKFQDYLESNECRRKFILNYFNDPSTTSLSIRPDCCDNCDLLLSNSQSTIEYEELNSEGMYDLTPDTKILLNAIQTVGPFYGLGMSIILIRGSNSKRLPQKFSNHPMRGVGVKKNETWWKLLYDILLRKDFVMTTLYGSGSFNKLTKVSVTDAGKQWLQFNGSKPLFMVPKRDMLSYFTIKRKENVGKLPALIGKENVSKLNVKGDTRSTLISVVDRVSTPQEELRKRLFKFRLDLANQLEAMPYMMATERCINQMSENPPTRLELLSKYDGFAEGKIKTFGHNFIKFIRETLETFKHEFPGKFSQVWGKNHFKFLIFIPDYQPTDPKDETDDAGASSSTKIEKISVVRLEIKSAPRGKNEVPLLNDEYDDEILQLEQDVFKNLSDSPSEPPAKKKLLAIASVPGIKFDSDSDSDEILSTITDQDNHQTATSGWLSTRGSSEMYKPGTTTNKSTKTLRGLW